MVRRWSLIGRFLILYYPTRPIYTNALSIWLSTALVHTTRGRTLTPTSLWTPRAPSEATFSRFETL
jgi:hypothetical protein